MNVVLVGFKSSGKTTLAKAFAALTGKTFVDCDTLLETRYAGATGNGLSFREIYTSLGEAGFRELEGQVLESLATVTNTVVATGGGVVACPGAAALLQACGCVVFVNAEPCVVEKRLAGVNSPLFATHDFMALYTARRPLYHAAAHVVFPVTQEECPAVLAARLHKLLHEQYHGA